MPRPPYRNPLHDRLDVAISTNVPHVLAAVIRESARADGRTVADYVRKTLEQAVQRPTFSTAARDTRP